MADRDRVVVRRGSGCCEGCQGTRRARIEIQTSNGEALLCPLCAQSVARELERLAREALTEESRHWS